MTALVVITRIVQTVVAVVLVVVVCRMLGYHSPQDVMDAASRIWEYAIHG